MINFIPKKILLSKIEKVEYDKKISEEMGWSFVGIKITLDNGNILVASSDDEGNEAGSVYTSNEIAPVLPVIRYAEKEDILNHWGKKVESFLKGKTIIKARYITEKEKKYFYWSKKSLILFFEDGEYICFSQDDEGNDAGSVFTNIKNYEVIPTI